MGQSRATRADGAPTWSSQGRSFWTTGRGQGRHRGPRRPDRRHRQGRQPRHMSGVDPALVIGPSTEVLAGNGKILTAVGVDCHVHLIAPQQIPEALGSGMTTLIAGGTGPVEGTEATTVTPGARNLARMLESLDDYPVNVALLGKGTPFPPRRWTSSCAAAPPGSSCTRTGAPHPRSSTPASQSRARRRAGRAALGHLERGRFRRVHPRRHRRPVDRSTPTTPKAPGAVTPRTSSRSRRTRTYSRARRTRPGRTP